LELREKIGLPIARGKDPHVENSFYKFLVRQIYFYDKFRIFNEYDRVSGEVPAELALRIEAVRCLIDELLNKGLNMRKRYEEYDNFVREQWKKWRISE
jgi:hypothetical protein